MAAGKLRRGDRKVLWTQPTAHLSNFLYDWMHAWTWQRRGLDIVCLRTPTTEPWIPLFAIYWGGYLSTWRHGIPGNVIAPWFHIRPEGAAWQLDPRWTVVTEIPSHWALPGGS